MRTLIGKLLAGSFLTAFAHLASAHEPVVSVVPADWLVICGIVIGAAIALRRLND